MNMNIACWQQYLATPCACGRCVRCDNTGGVTLVATSCAYRTPCSHTPWIDDAGHPAALSLNTLLPAPQDELYMNGAVVLPHKEIKESVPLPAIIL